ncbi:hypothetical protein QTH90_16525 [Variovorax sp. J2P1-59]|uniref:hypothetical protein n=1 Tax=Variovorax flavidus TaxID=3053501 RepID=UPI002575536D|nr:hypothetical protein [Variovorax sp. J2P1-59]MDM0076012.1 hypothetical protein [Variovorax sp. J2P1-59]
MSVVHRSAKIAGMSDRLLRALNTLAEETQTLVQALLSPRSIIEEVEEMRALQVRANAIEARDPARAAVLRWHASRVGLR